MVHVKSWFPIKLREAAGGDFSWASKPAQLHRLDQNGPKNLRIDSVEVLPSTTSQVRGSKLRVDADQAARQRFSKMLHEKPLPALPIDDPPPPVGTPSKIMAQPSSRRNVSGCLSLDEQGDEPEPSSINHPQSKFITGAHLLPNDIMSQVDDGDEATAFGNYVVFLSRKKNDRNERSMRAVDILDGCAAASRNLILLKPELSNMIKQVLRVQDRFTRAESSLATKDRMHLAFAHQLNTQIAAREASLRAKVSLASSITQRTEHHNNHEIELGLNDAASTQQAELLIMKLSLVNAEQRRDALASCLKRQGEELRSQQDAVNACLAEAFKSADPPKEQVSSQPPTQNRESDVGVRYQILCEQLGIDGEAVDAVAS